MAYNKVVLNGEVLIDLSQDTVHKGVLIKDNTAHDAFGKEVVGVLEAQEVANASNIVTGKYPPSDLSNYWVPVDASHDEIQKNVLNFTHTKTIIMPDMCGATDPSISSYAIASPTDINGALGYAVVRKYESSKVQIGVAKINQDYTAEALGTEFSYSSSNSYVYYLQDVVDTTNYLYILTGYGSSTSSYRTYTYLLPFNKKTNKFESTISILSSQYSLSLSMEQINDVLYIMCKHNSSSTSTSSSGWYYKVYKMTAGTTSVSTVYNVSGYSSTSGTSFIYENLIYTNYKPDNSTSSYAIFNTEGKIEKYWYPIGNIKTPTAIYKDWFVNTVSASVSGASQYYFHAYNMKTEELVQVFTGVSSLTFSNVFINGDYFVARSGKTLYFYPIHIIPNGKNTINLVPGGSVSSTILLFNEEQKKMVSGSGVVDAYYVSAEGELDSCGIYYYNNEIWKPSNTVIHANSSYLRFSVEGKNMYCLENALWIDFVSENDDFLIEGNTGYIHYQGHLLCEKTEVGYQRFVAAESIKPGAEYVCYYGDLQTYPVNLMLTNVTTNSAVRAIAAADTLSLIFEADSNYSLPVSVIVLNAKHKWNAETGELLIGQAYGEVSVIVSTEREIEHKGEIPAHATYYVKPTSTTIGTYTGASATYAAGQQFPTTVNDGDVYVYGDYEYKYNYYWNKSAWTLDTTLNGWGVRVLDNTKTEYITVLSTINNKNVVSLIGTFYDCASLIVAPILPTTAVYLNYCFYNCTSLAVAPDLSRCLQVKNMQYMFDRCAAMNTYMGNQDGVNNFVNYYIPITVENMKSTFSGCTQITVAPNLANCSVLTIMEGTFYECSSLVDISQLNIPASVTNISYTFYLCSSLTGTVVLNITPTTYTKCLYGTNITAISGSCGNKDVILNTK